MVCGLGTVYGVVPARLATHCWISCWRAGSVEGNFGIDGSGFLKLSALVKSPTAARRQALKLGTSAPKRVSRKRNTEVWSKRSEDTNPPRVKGERRGGGTRKLSQMGRD